MLLLARQRHLNEVFPLEGDMDQLPQAGAGEAEVYCVTLQGVRGVPDVLRGLFPDEVPEVA